MTAGPDHPLRFVPDPKTGAPIPYLHVRGGLEARLARPVYYALVEQAVEQEGARLRIVTPSPEAVLRELLRADAELAELEVRRAGLAEALGEIAREAA